jgi:hypothetical protein
MNRVTEYKVRKAIASGIPLDEETLVLAIQRPPHEVHAVLVKMYPDQFGIPGVDVPRRSTATLDELVVYARPIFEKFGINAVLDYSYSAIACCCLGPINDDPLCACSMRQQLAMHKSAVAARLMEEQRIM